MTAPLARDTAALMEGLDRHRLAKGSPELYDALLQGSPHRVRDELVHFLRHPLAAELGDWLRARGVQPPAAPTNDEVLARLGIADIEAHLARKEAELAKLRQELASVTDRGHSALKAATGYSATTALLFGAAVLGWLAAFGVIPFTPELTPTVEMEKARQDAEKSGAGLDLPSPGQR